MDQHTRNLKGTTVLTVFCPDHGFVASVGDGRGAVAEEISPDSNEFFNHIVRGYETKIFEIGGDYLATIAGSKHYGEMALNEINALYSKNTLSMKKIVKSVQKSCFRKWKNEPDKKRFGDNINEFPATICVFGLDNYFTITSNPKNIGIDTFYVEGKKVVVRGQGQGANDAFVHLCRIKDEDRLEYEPTKMKERIMESVCACAVQNRTTGGFPLAATLTRTGTGPAVTFFERPHFTLVVAQRFRFMFRYLLDSFLLYTSGDYYENPQAEGQLEKHFKDKFEGQLYDIFVVGVRKGSNPMTARILKFFYKARASAVPELLKMGLDFELPTKARFKKLAEEFGDPQNCF